MESENHLFWRDNHFPNLQFCSSMLVSGGVEERPVCVDIAASGSRFFSQITYVFWCGKRVCTTCDVYDIWHILAQEHVFWRENSPTAHFTVFFSPATLGRCSKFQQYPGDSPCLVDTQQDVTGGMNRSSWERVDTCLKFGEFSSHHPKGFLLMPHWAHWTHASRRKGVLMVFE